MEVIDNKKFLYPPGGILIWIVILIEVITFSAGIITFVWQRNLNFEIYEIAQGSLSKEIGLANTLMLLVSGFFVAESVRFLKSGNSIKSQYSMWIAILFGFSFLIWKGVEYAIKIDQGFDLTFNSFYTFYWLLTGFHFLHVLTGLIILSVLTFKIKDGIYDQHNIYDIESGAAFWHLCDVIWLLLFPILYLI